MNHTARVKHVEKGLVLQGSLAFASVSALLKEADVLLKNHQDSSVIIDCEEVSRIDSAGIALLIEWKRWCNNHQKQCQISGLPKQARCLIETYRLQQVLSV